MKMRKKLVMLLVAVGFFSNIALAEEYVLSLKDKHINMLIPILISQSLNPSNVTSGTIDVK